MLNGDLRRSHPRFQPENLSRNRALVDRMQALAARQGCTAAQLAIAWLLHQRDFIVPVPGTRHIEYLDDNAGAAELTLAAETMVELSRIFAAGAVAGDRYPSGLLARVHI
jgi:aryl-alcohol dehydrogenase-like predicted oxidoreductase